MGVKEQMKSIIDELPDDSTYDQILRELAFRRMIDRGLKDFIKGKTISNVEMGKIIKLFGKIDYDEDYNYKEQRKKL
ncbi:MAG: hypothetical protein PVH88_22105 [Ignavibacteria bacterium]|jgi:hypothetical protein